jgi:hypothetical protein
MPDADPIRVIVAEDVTPAEVGAIARSATEMSIDVSFEVEGLSSEEIAEFVDLVDDWLRSGRSVRLLNAPQMLAHTLYKVGRLSRSGLLTVSMCGTEPYPG